MSILSISSKINFFKESSVSPASRQLLDSLDLVKIRLQALADEKNAYERERDLLLANQALTGKDQALPVEQLVKAADFYRSRFKEINGAISEIQRKTAELNAAMTRLNGQINQAKAGSRPTSEVFVEVEAKSAAASELKLRYVVDNAGWSPVYDLVSTGLSEPIRLKYRALAFNDTGLDWDEVKIRLSTADPYQGAGQPNLTAWILDNKKPTEMDLKAGVMRMNENAKGRSNLELKNQSQNYTFQHDLNPDIRYDAKVAAPAFAFETIEISELSTDFDIETPYTIPANAKPYSIEIIEHQLEATYKHFSVPKLDKDAFLLAQITGWEKLDLITGPINVYRNENFIGMAQLNPRTLSDTLELSLGRDANVVVKREKVKEYSRRQFLGGNKFSSFSWKISVKNNHSQPISIEIQDQVPVSEVKEISVEVKEISGARRIADSGKLVWEFNLPPDAVKTMQLNFTVKHPDNLEVEMEQMRKSVSPRYF